MFLGHKKSPREAGLDVVCLCMAISIFALGLTKALIAGGLAEAKYRIDKWKSGRTLARGTLRNERIETGAKGASSGGGESVKLLTYRSGTGGTLPDK